MPEVGASEAASTRRALAVLVQWPLIVLEASILQAKTAMLDKHLSISRIARRKHTIEQVDTDRHCAHQVTGCPHAHQVVRPLRIERRPDHAERLVHRRGFLAHAATTE